MMPLLRKAHKWLALIVGLQLMIWVTTGLLFTLVDSSKARGQVYRANLTSAQPPALSSRLLTNAQFAEKIPQYISLQQIRYVELKAFQRHWYFQVVTKSGRYLFSATTGQQLLVDEILAVKLIKNSYLGPGSLKNLKLLSPPIAKFNKVLGNIWQANFDDELNTQVYLSQNTGRILKHTNDVSDYNDILKLLHFMDYDQSGHFNSWWIILMALIASLLSFTGSFWLISIYGRKFKKRIKQPF